MEIIVTTADQLQNLIDKTVDKSIRSALSILTQQRKDLELKTEEKLLTTKDVCQLFSKTKATIINWRKKGLLQAHKIGSRIFYKESECIQALEKLEVRNVK